MWFTLSSLMTRSRRSVLTAGATGGLVVTAGCLEFVLGDGPLEFEAERAGPSEAALDEAGYEETEVTEESFEETVEVGVEREINASVWISTYTKSIAGDDFDDHDFDESDVDDDLVSGAGHGLPLSGTIDRDEETDIGLEGDSDGSIVTVVSTPEISVLGQSVTHLEGMDSEELLSEFGIDAGGDIEEADSATLEILGEKRSVDRFVGSFEGQPFDVEIVMTAFGYDGDYLVAVSSYPNELENEREHAETLLTSLEHGDRLQ